MRGTCAYIAALMSVCGLLDAQPVAPMYRQDSAKQARKRALKQQLPSVRGSFRPVFPHRLAELRAEDLPVQQEGRVLAGVHRKAPEITASAGRWDVLPQGGRTWRIAVDAQGAAGWRVHFTDFDAGEGRVWVHDGTGAEAEIGGPYSNRGPFGDGDFWSDTVLSDTLVIEFETTSESDVLPFRVEEISQLLPGSPVTAKAGGLPSRAVSASCNLDVSCYPDWAETARAVGHLVFEDSGGSYVCSGTLVNTRNGSGIPYFLTADHCIGTDSVARTAQTFWRYQTSSCNGVPPERRDSPRVLGARYMAGGGRSEGDFSLLRLSEAPADAYYSGWNPDDINEGAEVTVIHHPAGDHKRISFGSRTTPRPGVDNFYRIRYTQGVTEGGSSGSGLFSSPGILTGILSSGPKAETAEEYCTLSPFVDNYGKFSAAYRVLGDYLEERTTEPAPERPRETRVLSAGEAREFTIEPAETAILFNGAQSYTIEVPQGATSLEIRLETSTPDVDIDLFVRHGSDTAISDGIVVADHRSTGPTGTETIVIGPLTSPALRPGTYYISLGIFTTGVRATGTIRASISTSPGPPPNLQDGNLLVPGVPRTFSFEPRDNPTLYTGAHSYQVTVPQGATRLEIQLTTTTPGVDVDLFVRFGSDNQVVNGEVVSDHRSTGNTGDERIVITPESTPALRPGTYYVSLAVFTTGTGATGEIRATIGAGAPPPAGGATVLASGEPRSFVLSAVERATLFNGSNSYAIDVPAGASSLIVQLTTATAGADIDLFVRHGTDTAVVSGEVVADHSSTGPTGAETLIITSASTPALRPGRYFISLAQFTTGVESAGTLRATVNTGSTPAPPVSRIELQSGVAAPFQLPAVDEPTLFTGSYSFTIHVPEGVPSLRVQVASDLPAIDVDLFVRHGEDVALNDANVISDFDSTGLTGNESIEITSASRPVLRPGIYYISLALFTRGVQASGTVTGTLGREVAPTSSARTAPNLVKEELRSEPKRVQRFRSLKKHWTESVR